MTDVSEADLKGGALDGLKSALEQQIRSILRDGVSLRTLDTLVKFCGGAQRALMAVETSGQLVKNAFELHIDDVSPVGEVMNVQLPSGQTINATSMNAVSLPPGLGALAPAPALETYGANALRNFMDNFKDSFTGAFGQIINRPPSMTDLVTAVAQARAEGMDDVAAALETKLRERMGLAAEEEPDVSAAEWQERLAAGATMEAAVEAALDGGTL